MKQVLKQKLKLGLNTLQLPVGSEISHFGWQDTSKSFYIWYTAPAVYEGATLRAENLYVALTGESVNDEYELYGTAMTPDGGFVAHLFIVKQ